jgi:hypothetical protein
VKPAKFGQVHNFISNVKNYGIEKPEYWQGVDINGTGRIGAAANFQAGTSIGRSTVDACELAKVLPETFLSGQTLVFDPMFGNFQAPLSQCKVQEDWRMQFKGLATYIVPRVDVLVSATFQSAPGVQVGANFNAPNALVAPSLGRNLSGGAANTALNIAESGKQYGERTNLLDLRFANILRFAGTRTNVSIDLYNSLNGNAGTAYNQTFGPSYLVPTLILPARFAKFSMQVDW